MIYNTSMEAFWTAFIPLFVAFDGVGVVPIFVALTQRLGREGRVRAATEAVVTAFSVSLAFLLVSRSLFRLMGLELADITVAGGAILLVLCLRELVMPEPPPEAASSSPGVVPLGVPLLAGPAVLTTVLLVRDQVGWPVTLAALAANMVLAWAVLRGANVLIHKLGSEGARLMSKVFNLILAAFGVMLIRRGVTAMLALGLGE